MIQEIKDQSTKLSFSISEIDLIKNTLDKFPEVNSDIIAFFFTGSWCLPCIEFQKQLISFYEEKSYLTEPNDLPEGTKKFEIIHVASEKTKEDFEESVKDIPWPIIQYNNKAITLLANELKIENVPMLVVVMKNSGEVITRSGRMDVMLRRETAVDDWVREFDILKKNNHID